MVTLYSGIYTGKRVLITGNTGFKGSWLARWLTMMGATVIGYSRDLAVSQPNHHTLLDPYETVVGDVCDLQTLSSVLSSHKIDIVFHLAAQALVRYSYEHVIETFSTNVVGTATVIEACRANPSVKGCIIVTSDKCYENLEDDRAYREDDRMGGYDPYSASKGCAELVTSSLRRSFLEMSHPPFILVSVRAGNVIGGGDWSTDRLIPDIMKSAAQSQVAQIRNPHSTRPWQHVLEPLSGYLMLGQRALMGDASIAGAWNFGPSDKATLTVGEVIEIAKQAWDAVSVQYDSHTNHPHEAKYLRLDSHKAMSDLHWRPLWNTHEAITQTVLWYKDYYVKGTLTTDDTIRAYITQASINNLPWTL